MNKRPTLKDVGKAADVSVYVASKALRGADGVAESTRRKVVKAASQIGYVRNGVAAGLRTQSGHTVGILTASGRNQYYSMLTHVVAGALREYGYYAMTSDVLEDKANVDSTEEESVRLLLEQRPAAVIAAYPMSAKSLGIIESFQVPVVFVDQPSAANVRWPFVGSDNYQAGRLAGEYLGKLNHKNIVVLTYPKMWSTCLERIRGFEEKARKWSMKVTVVESDNTPEEAARKLGDILDNATEEDRPDAVFALNILMVMGTYKALNDRGVRIGKDLSVISVDDFDWAPMLTPPLTVISQNMDEIGRQAARFVLDEITGDSMTGQKLSIPVRLIERRSCRKR
ncbi:LacI family DNA-binding transcriptional regulator [Bifidobacterium sp. ESL0775]|uniref:LacI family DNA-binding transcriptional regulator n=1 Tax=Bifidobacterium sp. ESL0775 TaxID=2983230 RepID=UPI0023F6BB4A|nr:LacI family DNA-binding transcriptional regulator [Bifidobacterium sp. ESL0775]WEV69869.1 LacI family DNA-binding transcriptional regulator [Bifidobacterium sp. ESL0775]